MNILSEELAKRYEPIYYDEFYKNIFNDDLGHQELDQIGECTPGMYVGIATRISTFANGGGVKSHNYYLYDDLGELGELVATDREFLENETRRLTIISPISYAGSRRTSENARFLYALVIEIDNLRTDPDQGQVGLADLLHQMDKGILPKATYIVASGNGVHLYYKFVKPIPCFKNVKKSLWRYKKALTKKLWNRYVTFDYQEEKIQYESVFQGFRMVGTQTKSGDSCDAFIIGDSVTIEYMNSFVAKKAHMELVYKSELTRAKAKELYPDWYERRIVQGNTSRGHWTCNRALYDWWLNKIRYGAVVGHRYYCLMCLAIYAVKCDIEYDELKRDAYSFLDPFDAMTVDAKNPFRIEDVEAALDIWRSKGDNLNTYPITYLEKHSGIEIPRNKRNGRKQADHVKMMNFIRDEINHNVNWREGNGRKPSHVKVQSWRALHPEGRKCDCIQDLGIDKKTCYKWWDIPCEPLDLSKGIEQRRQEEDQLWS